MRRTVSDVDGHRARIAEGSLPSQSLRRLAPPHRHAPRWSRATDRQSLRAAVYRMTAAAAGQTPPQHQPGMARPEARQMQVADLVAIDFEPRLRMVSARFPSGTMSSSTVPALRTSPERPVQDSTDADQRHQRIHPDPAPKKRPASSATIASTEVMASASTCR